MLKRIQVWTNKLAQLLLAIKEAVQSAKSISLASLDITLQNSFSIQYEQILTEAELVIRGSPKSKDYHLSAPSLFRRFIRNKDLILKFMTDFRVPFDNNGSERDLRMLKLQQKISGCFRTTEGATIFCLDSFLSEFGKKARQRSA